MFFKGQTITVKSGPFEGHQVIVERTLPEKGLVCVLVVLYGRQTPVEIEERHLVDGGDDDGDEEKVGALR